MKAFLQRQQQFYILCWTLISQIRSRRGPEKDKFRPKSYLRLLRMLKKKMDREQINPFNLSEIEFTDSDSSSAPNDKVGMSTSMSPLSPDDSALTPVCEVGISPVLAPVSPVASTSTSHPLPISDDGVRLSAVMPEFEVLESDFAEDFTLTQNDVPDSYFQEDFTLGQLKKK